MGALSLSLWSMCARVRSSYMGISPRSPTVVYVSKSHDRKKTLRNLYEPGSEIFGTEILLYIQIVFWNFAHA